METYRSSLENWGEVAILPEHKCYIYSAKLYLGDDFDKLQDAVKKMWRKRFKTIFLGVNKSVIK